MPTILDYLKIPIPDFIHGRSLLNLFLNNEIGKTKTEYFFVETAWREIDKIGVYSKDWEFFINRDKIRNLDPEELQFIDKIEHGNRSNKVDKYPAIAKKLKRILNRWRKKYPRQKRVSSKKELSDKEIDQLKTLGYL